MRVSGSDAIALTSMSDASLEGCDVVFSCLPHGESAAWLERAPKDALLVDLSADLRPGNGASHTLAGRATYGLTELARPLVRDAKVIANPGCYPTAALLALVPLARAGLIGGTVVIDAKSGVSGAGRGATDTTHFVSANEDLKPYEVAGHRHRPEIEQELGHDVLFVPHLAPMSHGELDSCYVPAARETNAEELREAYADYLMEPFVELIGRPPGVLEVRETNDCRLFVHLDEHTNHICVFAAIDNLWKGTASQAIQSLNLMFGREETEGLP
jgi:N-acetyl-gamma-glutamyl-phosphate reductase